ncbi:hypothetical protein POSPLADRAFT_1045115 [Postia placenta MAD-698-R-SB12]|uniref:Cryptic loci regulator 2 N-terminal domain-containing protein n=1 Tax=Postia placenta MAD-698-R-SB12 TaxID=670580 RepID=A0A1X6N5S2_9APHY|nr:hypothetical protein POSPLADRAFT_1045115 [Postia placenta MAD-698-R-SB12]OSX63971.1 hypothetical protein POSPLADRAFT_1045115 [Postia placenta MAD-698-R-SB12]
MQEGLTANHVLPENPSWIEFPRTDGDISMLPRNTQRIVDNEGNVNFMRPVDDNESTAISWRVGVAAQIAKKLAYPGKSRMTCKGQKYVLRSFPDGYQLFDHNKGPATAPRHDPYLCGSKLVNRFRSVNEFIPHAIWLMQDATSDRANCECKYCAKKPQRQVTDALDLPRQRASGIPSATPSKGLRRLREPRVVKNKPYAAVRRVPKPVKQLTGPEQALAPERDADIRAGLVGDAPRWYRRGELLWCALDPPIRGRTEADTIYFWPGIVHDVAVKTEAIPRVVEAGGQSASGNIDMTALYVQDTEENSAAKPDESHEPYLPQDSDQKVPWTVRQWNVYTMKLLAVTHEYFVSDSQLLPYLAHAPSEELTRTAFGELMNLLDETPIPEMDKDLSRVFPFNPVHQDADGTSSTRPGQDRFRQAVAPFTLAVQIASNLARFWCQTDEWECKYTISPAIPPSNSQAPEPAPSSTDQHSLHALITQSMANNATTDLSARASAQNLSQTVTQTRFQGLWWGAERIWTDELVRLKLARCQFAPEGTDVILPPSGPSKSTLAFAEAAGAKGEIDPRMMGAGEKGLFLRLEGVFAVEVTKEDGTISKECRASGTLYELADEALEDENMSGVHATGPESVSQVGNGPSFMPGPSPLKPPPLPNPDPTVPLEETAAAAISQTVPLSGRPKKRTVGGQLSHPVLSTFYPLPEPPRGYKFRAIHPSGHEVVLSLSLISGRYYPQLLAHPLMVPTVQKAFHLPPEQGGLFEHRHLWAMEGLLPGVHQSMEPAAWKGSRFIMFKDADAQARAQFHQLWANCKREREQGVVVPVQPHEIIDVDMLPS